jgi:hypothetical protein
MIKIFGFLVLSDPDYAALVAIAVPLMASKATKQVNILSSTILSRERLE